MSAMTNLLVKDDASTPVELTFRPVTDTPHPQWRGTVSGVSLEGQPRVHMIEEALRDGTERIVLKTEIPVMETLGASGTSAGYVAPQKVAYVNTMVTTLYANKRSTDADRANLMKVHVGLLQGATSTSGTGTLDQASAGGAFAASSAPVPLMMIGLVVPN